MNWVNLLWNENIVFSCLPAEDAESDSSLLVMECLARFIVKMIFLLEIKDCDDLLLGFWQGVETDCEERLVL